LVTARSARDTTVVVVVPVLLPGVPSVVVLAAVAEFVMSVPFGVTALTFTTIVNTAVSPPTTTGFEKITFPVPPGGVLRLQPAAPDVTTADTNVVLGGTASVTVTEFAELGPLLTKLIV
jgi:hypothetical protein